MEQHEIDAMRRRHRRAWFAPWLCRECRVVHPCPPWLLAEEEQLKTDSRARVLELLRAMRTNEGRWT